MSYLVTAPLVVAKDAEGKLVYHYAGAVIPWLSEVDKTRFVADGMVSDLPGADARPAKPAQKR